MLVDHQGELLALVAQLTEIGYSFNPTAEPHETITAKFGGTLFNLRIERGENGDFVLLGPSGLGYDLGGNIASLRQVVDYEVIFLAVRKLEQNAHCECLESSILEVMDAVFGIAAVSSAFVSMHKPHVYNGQGTPAISLSMTRQQWTRTRP